MLNYDEDWLAPCLCMLVQACSKFMSPRGCSPFSTSGDWKELKVRFNECSPVARVYFQLFIYLFPISWRIRLPFAVDFSVVWGRLRFGNRYCFFLGFHITACTCP